ncbi:MAG: hypothetical protein L6R36_006218 [Xanthoria steineri]|nr:MAG: hypothetical protein L6R36_006218 [Xanthoria steineri]
MDSIITTPRLKLTLITSAERGTKEFEWLHELRSNEKATWWRVVYAVHMLVDPTTDTGSEPAEHRNETTRFVGVVNLASSDANSLQLPDHLILPNPATTTPTLSTEISYLFLPVAWGKGYATESVNAAFEACKRVRAFWAPFPNVYVRAIVNRENPASLRVMGKTGMVERGVYKWSGEPIFLAGEWTVKSTLHIFGRLLLRDGDAD